jgi:hypothetical protein
MNPEPIELQSKMGNHETFPLHYGAGQSSIFHKPGRHSILPNHLGSVRQITNEPIFFHSNQERSFIDAIHSQHSDCKPVKDIVNFGLVNKPEIRNFDTNENFPIKVSGSVSDPEDIVLNDFIIRYLSNFDEFNYKPTTIMQRMHLFNIISQELGSLNLKEISIEHINTFLNQKTPSKIRRLKTILNHILNQAILAGKLMRNPMDVPRKIPNNPTIDAMITMFEMILTGSYPEQVCEKINVSLRTFYNWKKEYSSLKLDDLYNIKDFLLTHPSINEIIITDKKNFHFYLKEYMKYISVFEKLPNSDLTRITASFIGDLVPGEGPGGQETTTN